MCSPDFQKDWGPGPLFFTGLRLACAGCILCGKSVYDPSASWFSSMPITSSYKEWVAEDQ